LTCPGPPVPHAPPLYPARNRKPETGLLLPESIYIPWTKFKKLTLIQQLVRPDKPAKIFSFEFFWVL
jgi:hypothetical protein